MAGETISLDYTQPAAGEEGSDTPLLPGYQLVHSADDYGRDFYQVRRVTVRTSVKLAQRGIAEETVTYPRKYESLDDALAAAAAAFDKDGPGDSGEDANLAAAAAQVVAARKQA